MSNKKIKSEQVSVNTQTGEIIETTKIYNIKVENSEHFYMVYIDTMHRYFNIKVGIDFKVLAKLCLIAHYNTGQAVVSTALRKKWCEDLEASSQNLSNSFKRLIDLKLIAGEKGSYIINPEVFWRGEYEEKKKFMKNNSIKLTFELD